MGLKDKQKVVQVIGAAEEALNKLEESIHATQAHKGSHPLNQIYSSIEAYKDHSTF